VRTDAHLRMRRECSTRIIEKIGEWLIEESLRQPPKSRFGAALRYAGRQWVALTGADASL
jgi:hypothetical protein